MISFFLSALFSWSLPPFPCLLENLPLRLPFLSFSPFPPILIPLCASFRRQSPSLARIPPGGGRVSWRRISRNFLFLFVFVFFCCLRRFLFSRDAQHLFTRMICLPAFFFPGVSFFSFWTTLSIPIGPPLPSLRFLLDNPVSWPPLLSPRILEAKRTPPWGLFASLLLQLTSVDDLFRPTAPFLSCLPHLHLPVSPS